MGTLSLNIVSLSFWALELRGNKAPPLNIIICINITEIKKKFMVTRDIASCLTKITTNSVSHE